MHIAPDFAVRNNQCLVIKGDDSGGYKVHFFDQAGCACHLDKIIHIKGPIDPGRNLHWLPAPRVW